MTKEEEINRQRDRQTDIRTKSKNTGAAAGTPQNTTCLSHDDDDEEEEEEEEEEAEEEEGRDVLDQRVAGL